jgi:hypothetical protein
MHSMRWNRGLARAAHAPHENPTHAKPVVSLGDTSLSHTLSEVPAVWFAPSKSNNIQSCPKWPMTCASLFARYPCLPRHNRARRASSRAPLLPHLVRRKRPARSLTS